MKIAQLYIENFRSINTLNIKCRDLTVFLGKNSVGKSNVLLALDLFFNTSDKILCEDMFCSFSANKENIIIELTFERLTEAEKIGRLKKYVCSSLEHGLKVKKTIYREKGKLKSRYQGWVEEPSTEWLKSDFRDYGRQAYWQGLGIDFFSYTSASSSRITREIYEDFRTNYIKKHEAELKFELTLSGTDFEGLKTVGVDMLPQFKLIPAIGDVSEVVAGTSKSLLTRLVRDIINGASESEEILKTTEEGLNLAAELINRSDNGRRLPQINAIEKWFCNELIEWGRLDFEVKTSFPDISTLLTQNLQLLVNDGASGDITTKGHGLQRQIIFKMIHLTVALVEGKVDWLAVGDTLPESPPIILAFEEPELYLHPQAQMSFYDDIKKLSLHDQIFVCTHSTHLLDIEDYDGIKILKRELLSSPTEIFECTEDLFNDLTLKKRLALAKLFDSNVNKLFFADKIVIAEGDTEVIAITKTAKEYTNCFTHRVTIINAGGKENTPSLQKVLNAFKIPYTVVYDVDPGNPSSEETTICIEQYLSQAEPFGLSSSMPMDPNLAKVIGYDEPSSGKAAACVMFFEESTPSDVFIEKVRTLYSLPSAGILAPE
ncbi:MAG: AAA family ATPase [Phycisphaerae bacterium]|jgi:CRISPR-associated exonuclease Cas4